MVGSDDMFIAADQGTQMFGAWSQMESLPDTDAAVIKQQQQATASYVVIDRHTGLQVGHSYATRARAARRVDALDNAYGAYRYCVRAVSNA